MKSSKQQKEYWNTFFYFIIIACVIGLSSEFIKYVNKPEQSEYRHQFKKIGY